MNYDVIVVGGGAAGIIAAGSAGARGLKVLLLEKNDRLGKKILISGKGRCNITNETDLEGLIANTPGNGNFLYSAFSKFSNWDIVDLLNKYGLETKVERGNRVFPVSDRAWDVVDTLKKYLEENDVKVYLDAAVNEILVENNKVVGIKTKNGQKFECNTVILATGGVSYPGTGSTGDGIKIAKKLGHKIVDLKPSLVPLISKDTWVMELQGLSLRNIEIKVENSDGEVVYKDFGELMFTHFGITGPTVLSLSRHILKYDFKNIKVKIDLKPALDEEKLNARILRDFEKSSKKQFKNALDDLLPQKMIPVMIKLSGINPEKIINQITKAERMKLINLLKELTISIDGARPIEEAIVTVGGVSIDEINPSTMESKIIKGLYLAGEMIDVDAYTGGFNLTIAFSTGYLAGLKCK